MRESTCVKNSALNKGHIHIKGVTPERAEQIIKGFKRLAGVLACEYLQETQELRVDFHNELMDRKRIQNMLLELC